MYASSSCYTIIVSLPFCLSSRSVRSPHREKEIWRYRRVILCRRDDVDIELFTQPSVKLFGTWAVEDVQVARYKYTVRPTLKVCERNSCQNALGVPNIPFKEWNHRCWYLLLFWSTCMCSFKFLKLSVRECKGRGCNSCRLISFQLAGRSGTWPIKILVSIIVDPTVNEVLLRIWIIWASAFSLYGIYGKRSSHGTPF